jgi:Protein of unknown function (DUF3175)
LEIKWQSLNLSEPSHEPRQYRWSGNVTQHSDATDPQEGIFESKDPDEIAQSLKNSAEISKRRKSDPFRSAMSMLTFYINRAGKNLPTKRLKVLEDAKQLLHERIAAAKDREKRAAS